MAKKLLKVDNEYVFCVFGISSSAKDYRLCHFINKELQLNLVPKDEVVIENIKRNQNFIMNKFSCESAQSISNFHLINNKYSGEMLIKAMKNIDFFLIIEGELLKSELLQIKKTLQQINIIEHFMTVENQAFQGIEHIIFESEARKKN